MKYLNSQRKPKASVRAYVASATICLSALSAQATIRTVTNTLDSGPGSLRATILASHNGDTIVFDSSICGSTIPSVGTMAGPLTFPDPIFPLTIDATGCSITLSGGLATPVMCLNANADIYLNSLTIANGFNHGIVGCPAGGGSGGGIITDGLIQLTNCTLTNNHSHSLGGAISTANRFITLINSTVTGNTAGVDGAAIFSDDGLTLINTTITGNSSPGFSVSGSGVTAPVALFNTIVDDAATATSGNCFSPTCTGCLPLVAGPDNQANDDTCGNATVVTTADLHLGPLANNGGPTKTIALLTGSTAINGGINAYAVDAGLIYDQRGNPFSRYSCGNVDVGAYEAQCTICPSSNGFDTAFCPVDDAGLSE